MIFVPSQRTKKLWNMKVKVIPKGFVRGLKELEIGERTETIQTKLFLR